jgi:hypothetical protein
VVLNFLVSTFRMAGARVGMAALAGASLVAFTACNREEVAVYTAPKDQPVPPPPGAQSPHGDPAMMPAMAGGRPGITWTSLPEGWTSTGASGMRAANFTIVGEGDPPATAELSVIPLPGTGGSDVELVNLWRGQLQLTPITEEQLPAHTDETSIGGHPVKLFNAVGDSPEDAAMAGNQIVVAALRRDGFTWIFKMAGDAELVRAHRDALKTFLSGIEFTSPPPAGGPMASAAGAPSQQRQPAGPPPSPKWTVPDDWKSVPPTQMVLSKWTISGAGGTADVTVSVFPGETGGLVPNLNRWRSQVGLQPAPDAELLALADNLDVLGGKATLADFTGTDPESGDPERLLAAIVRRDGYSWFYKLLGPPDLVEAERSNFLRFVQTADYSNRP